MATLGDSSPCGLSHNSHQCSEGFAKLVNDLKFKSLAFTDPYVTLLRDDSDSEISDAAEQDLEADEDLPGDDVPDIGPGKEYWKEMMGMLKNEWEMQHLTDWLQIVLVMSDASLVPTGRKN